MQISPAVSVQHTVELSVISQLKQDNQRLAIELAGTVQYNQCIITNCLLLLLYYNIVFNLIEMKGRLSIVIEECTILRKQSR